MPKRGERPVQKPTVAPTAIGWRCPQCDRVRPVGVAQCPGCGQYGLAPIVIRAADDA